MFELIHCNARVSASNYARYYFHLRAMRMRLDNFRQRLSRGGNSETSSSKNTFNAVEECTNEWHNVQKDISTIGVSGGWGGKLHTKTTNNQTHRSAIKATKQMHEQHSLHSQNKGADTKLYESDDSDSIDLHCDHDDDEFGYPNTDSGKGHTNHTGTDDTGTPPLSKPISESFASDATDLLPKEALDMKAALKLHVHGYEGSGTGGRSFGVDSRDDEANTRNSPARHRRGSTVAGAESDTLLRNYHLHGYTLETGKSNPRVSIEHIIQLKQRLADGAEFDQK